MKCIPGKVCTCYILTEPECIELSERKARDREMFDAIVEDIGAGPVDVIDVVHLSTKSSNKLRPLRVQFNNPGHRRSVLANAKKLCVSSSDVFKGIYI